MKPTVTCQPLNKPVTINELIFCFASYFMRLIVLFPLMGDLTRFWDFWWVKTKFSKWGQPRMKLLYRAKRGPNKQSV